jgi:hypothetical protein
MVPMKAYPKQGTPNPKNLGETFVSRVFQITFNEIQGWLELVIALHRHDFQFQAKQVVYAAVS